MQQDSVQINLHVPITKGQTWGFFFFLYHLKFSYTYKKVTHDNCVLLCNGKAKQHSLQPLILPGKRACNEFVTPDRPPHPPALTPSQTLAAGAQHTPKSTHRSLPPSAHTTPTRLRLHSTLPWINISPKHRVSENNKRRLYTQSI